MVSAKGLGIKSIWTCIIMSYNEDDIESITSLAKNHNINIEFVKSSRWFEKDPFKPKNPMNVVDSVWMPSFEE